MLKLKFIKKKETKCILSAVDNAHLKEERERRPGKIGLWQLFIICFHTACAFLKLSAHPCFPSRCQMCRGHPGVCWLPLNPRPRQSPDLWDNESLLLPPGFRAKMNLFSHHYMVSCPLFRIAKNKKTHLGPDNSLGFFSYSSKWFALFKMVLWGCVLHKICLNLQIK